MITWTRIALSLAPLLTVTLIGACVSSDSSKTATSADSTTRQAPPPESERDIHSYARPWEARVTDVALDLATDFTAKQVRGTAALTVERATGAKEIVLDTRDLTIKSVADSAGRPLRFTVGANDSILGAPLTVTLPEQGRKIVVTYETSPGAAALQWLDPSQTAGKRHPYLFSQGQAILTRTWIPTQDSPGIRQTYTARVAVPKDLVAVMSAEMLTPAGKDTANGRIFEFRMTNPIPPYLIAIGVGDIAFRSLGPRSGVYAEPSVLDLAAREFVDVERMIDAAESLYGPYRWGRYDLLVLPPSFPFGGMENPRLTFATPTILAGDRSLVSLVAHELAHSWSGNLVTNATWSDFWLNEGFTTYIENRIMEQLYGKERAAMLEALARRELADELARFANDTGETILHIDVKGRNPDDAVTTIAYDKGAAFLRMLEEEVGRERFDQYLKGYFDRYAFKSITTAEFLKDLRANLLQGNGNMEQSLRIQQWVYGAGLPENATVPRSDAFARVEAEAKRFASGARASELATRNWTTQEWQHFLGALPERLSRAQLDDLDKTFGLSRSGNSEVLFAWLRIAIRNRYQPAMPALEQFLTTQGRRKFLRPLYEDLMNTDWGKAEARRIYQRARPLYHTVSRNTIDGIVK